MPQRVQNLAASGWKTGGGTQLPARVGARVPIGSPSVVPDACGNSNWPHLTWRAAPGAGRTSRGALFALEGVIFGVPWVATPATFTSGETEPAREEWPPEVIQQRGLALA